MTSFAVRDYPIYLSYLGVVAGNIQRTVSVRRLEHEDISTRTQSGIGKDVAKYMRMEIRNLSAIIQTLDLDDADLLQLKGRPAPLMESGDSLLHNTIPLVIQLMDVGTIIPQRQTFQKSLSGR